MPVASSRPLLPSLSPFKHSRRIDQIAGFAVPKAQHYIRVSLQALPLCLEAKQFHVPGAGGGRGQGRHWLGSSGSRGQHLSTVIKCLFVIRPFPPLQQKFSSIGTVCFQSHFQAGKNVPPPRPRIPHCHLSPSRWLLDWASHFQPWVLGFFMCSQPS